MTLATNVGVLEAGRLAQFDTPRAIYEDPDSVYVATRLGQPRINVAPRAVFPNYAAPPEAATLGLRPEGLAISASAPTARVAKIRRIERLGDQIRMHLALDGVALVALADHTTLQLGEEVAVSPVAPLFFDAEGGRIRARAA